MMYTINPKYNLIVILGPTASGKTRFASLLASKLTAEIISADSRQIYKEMDLGTGKDYNDYIVDEYTIPYHLIDIYPPGYKYNVFQYQQDFFEIYNQIISKHKPVILCGGTGMYIESVTKAYKLIAVPANNSLREKLNTKTLDELSEILSSYKKLHNKTDTDTKRRAIRAIEIEEYYKSNPEPEANYTEIKPIYLGVDIPREIRRSKITNRLHARLNEGMIQEVEKLLKKGINPDDLIYYGLEYKYLTLFVTGKINYDEMVKSLNIAIHQFAKRQMTWFRKMEREGIKINWINGILPQEEMVETALQLLK